MAETMLSTQSIQRDVTEDFLLCNRCGTCRAVCPVFLVFREEEASARGKVELAEAFFKGAEIDERRLHRIFDLCLHCMTCEENCPSGVRANEIIMAVRSEVAKRGAIPRSKRIALKALEGMDNVLFKTMRALGIVRRSPLHGVGGKSPLRHLFPLLGWPRERFVPLPKDSPFLSSGRELYEARDRGFEMPGPEKIGRIAAARGVTVDPRKAADLIGRIAAARQRNLAGGRRVYFFVGHAVNHFFPEEAEAIVTMLNFLGVDVLVPRDQVCCGAPIYYAGDIEGARRAAAEMIERFMTHRYDWIVTSCSSGGLMLKEEFPRLFDLTADGFFEIAWDKEMDSFRRVPSANAARKQYPSAADQYREYIEGKVYDVNEMVASMLGLREEVHGLAILFGAGEWDGGAKPAAGTAARKSSHARASKDASDRLPVVTYHHPCHLNRGQHVNWQPVALLERLPGHRYVPMRDADSCCGGGGTFTFAHAEAAEEIARKKVEAVAEVRPDVVATACPICRIQLMDMLHRRFVLHARERGEKPRPIPVKTPVELMLEDVGPLIAKM